MSPKSVALRTICPPQFVAIVCREVKSVFPLVCGNSPQIRKIYCVPHTHTHTTHTTNVIHEFRQVISDCFAICCRECDCLCVCVWPPICSKYSVAHECARSPMTVSVHSSHFALLAGHSEHRHTHTSHTLEQRAHGTGM